MTTTPRNSEPTSESPGREERKEAEERAESEGMQELAKDLSGDRARLHGAVERLAQGRQESEAAAGGAQ